MVPTIDQYIASSLRAMKEVVLPAIDKSESMALEQAQLVIGLLAMLGEHWDKTHALELAELRAHLRLGSDLEKVAMGGSATRAALECYRAAADVGSRFAGIDVPAISRLRDVNFALRASISSIVAASREDGTSECRRHVTALVLEHSASQNLLSRAWFANSRLDSQWSSLPPVSEVLARSSQPGND